MEGTITTTIFYQTTEAIISLIGAFLLLAIWYNIRQRFKQKLEEGEDQKRVDKGLLYLSCALLVWATKSIVFSFDHQFTVLALQMMTVLFSLLNSLFFVLAIFYFDHAPEFIYRNKKNVKRIILSFVIISLISIALFLGLEKGKVNIFSYSTIPDILISAVLSYLLIFSFYKTFKERQLQLIAYFSVGAILLMFLVQIPDLLPTLIEDKSYLDLFRIISKSALISLCLVLATSWVIEIAETPLPSEMSISFLDWSLIELSIPSKGIHRQTIDFKGRNTQFRNLLKFAIRRKYALVNEHCIEIIKGGEIQGQVYLTRIIEDINTSLVDTSAERKDIFTFIGLGKYRVRFIPNNITIDEALLHEFVNEEGNETYLSIVGG